MATNQPPLLRLERVEVDALFGIHDHRIHLNLEDRVTLLHGPNGVGKTFVLRMIDALLRRDIAYFSQVSFSRFLLGFQDGSALELKKIRRPDADGDMGTLALTKAGVEEHSTRILETDAESLAARIEYLEPHGLIKDTWIDVRDGEELDAEEVVSRFGGSVRKNRRREDLDWFDAFLRNADTHLIEAQRLVRPRRNPGSWPDFRFRLRGRPLLVSRVVECSEDFRKRFSDAMADYGRQAQTLDQTFPQRLISATGELAAGEIQKRMSALDDKTEQFKAIGILDQTPAHPFDVASLDTMDPTQARVMTLYVQDTERKLQALDDLASRTRLLLTNLNEKYRHKRIRLHRDEGLVAEGDGGRPLPLDSLSSGEQHEFVLHYDLLFRVRPNTVVLIDEPELSLHVAWQKKFLPDLMNVAELSGFDSMVATHSPFIVGDRDDLMVGLGESA